MLFMLYYIMFYIMLIVILGILKFEVTPIEKVLIYIYEDGLERD